MAVERMHARAGLGFSVHTGWSVMVAVSSEPTTTSVAVLDRRRLVMMPGSDPESPPFVYHAARRLMLDAAERFIRDCAESSSTEAKAALRAAVEDLASREHEVVASGIIVGGRPPAASLDAVLRSHPLIHAAEGELFRGAIRGASEALGIPVTEVRAGDLHSRAATALGIPAGRVARRLSEIGRAAGRPWTEDHKHACLAALIALAA